MSNIRHAYDTGIELDSFDQIPHEENEEPMTVCIAALGSYQNVATKDIGYVIIGASDRKLTVGVTDEYEPVRSKQFILTSSIIAMTAGDPTLSSEIVTDVQNQIRSQLESDPVKWPMVRDVAQQFVQEYKRVRLRDIEDTYLSRLDVSKKTFSEAQQAQLAIQVKRDLDEYKFTPLSFIVCGWDPSGMHIYSITMTKHDTIIHWDMPQLGREVYTPMDCFVLRDTLSTNRY